MIAPLFPADMTDASEAADRADPAEAAEPIEQAEAAEPIEKIEAAEPIEPIEPMEPMEPIERSESLLAMESIESRERSERRKDTSVEDSARRLDEPAQNKRPLPVRRRHTRLVLQGRARSRASGPLAVVLDRAAGGQVLLCERCLLAQTPLRRLKGLIGRRSLERGEGLLVRPSAAIHSCFMRFPIDVVFVDRRARVVGVVEQLAPWRAARVRGACEALELPAGAWRRAGGRPGDFLRYTSVVRSRVERSE
jgi:uncharacterized membrane protein (UPF0127 family)